MQEQHIGQIYPVAATLISIFYVISIYLFYDNRRSRDFQPNVRRRFKAAFLSNAIGLFASYFLISWHFANPFLEMGFYSPQFLAAVILPTLLTLLFYIGTLVSLAADTILSKNFVLPLPSSDILWLRRAIVAPLTEEITFRACSATLFRLSLGVELALFVAPICFSLAHIHHLLEDRRQGTPVVDALVNRGFQICYTYFFGLYATHIFFQTRHIVAPILSHCTCNLLGVPTVDEVHCFHSPSLRALLYSLHIGGFILWYLAFPHLLSAELYQRT